MKPIAASEIDLSNHSSVCVTGVLSHLGLRKANCEIGVVTGIQGLPGIAELFMNFFTLPILISILAKSSRLAVTGAQRLPARYAAKNLRSSILSNKRL